MKKIILGILLCSSLAHGAGPDEWESINLILQQKDKNGIDESRLFISEFSYFGENDCLIETVVVGNLNCPKGGRMFLGSEFSSWDYDKLECSKQNLSDDRRLITMTKPLGLKRGQIEHKFVLTGETFRNVVEQYTGTLNKYSSITDELITAEFIPVKGGFSGLMSFDINCEKIGDFENSYHEPLDSRRED